MTPEKPAQLYYAAPVRISAEQSIGRFGGSVAIAYDNFDAAAAYSMIRTDGAGAINIGISPERKWVVFPGKQLAHHAQGYVHTIPSDYFVPVANTDRPNFQEYVSVRGATHVSDQGQLITPQLLAQKGFHILALNGIDAKAWNDFSMNATQGPTPTDPVALGLQKGYVTDETPAILQTTQRSQQAVGF